MTSPHLGMVQLIALRDGDRSEPGLAETQAHLAACRHCQSELERLHQRTARLRALPTLAPTTDEFPLVHRRISVERRQRRRRITAAAALVTAAAMVAAVIGRDLVHPQQLDAEQQLQTAINRSQQLEQRLHDWNPDQRVVDGRTAVVVIQLEDRIADLDAQLAAATRLERSGRMQHELKLWQQRVGLMNALVDVHLTDASNVGI